MPRPGFDLRMWTLPESARDIPGKVLDLLPEETLEVFVEGGMETAEKVIPIVNTRLARWSVMAWVDLPAEIDENGYEKITFKMVNHSS